MDHPVLAGADFWLSGIAPDVKRHHSTAPPMNVRLQKRSRSGSEEQRNRRCGSGGFPLAFPWISRGKQAYAVHREDAWTWRIPTLLRSCIRTIFSCPIMPP